MKKEEEKKILYTRAGSGIRICLLDRNDKVFPESGVIERKDVSKGQSAASKTTLQQKDLKITIRPGDWQVDCHTSALKTQTELVREQIGAGFIKVSIPDEAVVFGFGAATGAADRNNTEFRLLNLDTMFYKFEGASYSSFPSFIVKYREYTQLFFLNLTWPVNVQIESGFVKMIPDVYEKDIPLDLFIFGGETTGLLSELAKLTGRPAMPPVWALGYHQSRWSYKTDKTVLQIAEKMREHDLPCDAIHLDIHYMKKYKVFTWNRKRFKQPVVMQQKLDTLGIRPVAIVDPGVKVEPGYKVYEEGREKGYFCTDSLGEEYHGKVWPGTTAFPDFTVPEVREWWADCHQELFKEGINGIWNDMNDPVLLMGKEYDPLKEDIQHAAGSHASQRNLYANYEAEASKRAFEKFLPGTRPFILTRSAFSGIQKYAFLWTGDNHTSWEHLRENLHMVINLGLSGVPFSGADCGGFGGGPGMTGVFKLIKKPELFSRWLELGSLMPYFRIHTSLYSYRQEPWSFTDVVLQNAKKHIGRRYSLLPYIYTLAYQAHMTGAPMVRPVFYEYPGYEALKNSSVFMLGPSIFAAPVLEKNVTNAEFSLPPGGWYEYETGRFFEGDKSYELRAEPGYYPLFIKAGTVLPTAHVERNAGETLANSLILEVYPDKRISGSVYHDDGISIDAATSSNLQIKVDGKELSKGRLQLALTVTKKKFTPIFSKITVRVPVAYSSAQIETKKIEADIISLNEFGRDFPVAEYSFRMKNMKITFYSEI